MAKRIAGIGEVLWDLLPDGKQLGGAPMNVVYHAASLGDYGIIASRVGQDPLGDEAVHRLKALGIGTDYLQEDDTRATGTVDVTVDESGQPDYLIHENVAWDAIAWTDDLAELARKADAVCFGSLAQRSSESRQTIQRFLQAADGVRVFDVNLRQDYVSAEILRQSFELATVTKLNDDELPRVCELLKLPTGEETAMASQLREALNLDLVCITRGADGCLLVTEEETIEEPSIEVKVKDTVGAGDAFTAALIHLYLRDCPLRRIAQGANQLGAWVATQAGGTPEADLALIEQIRQW